MPRSPPPSTSAVETTTVRIGELGSGVFLLRQGNRQSAGTSATVRRHQRHMRPVWLAAFIVVVGMVRPTPALACKCMDFPFVKSSRYRM